MIQKSGRKPNTKTQDASSARAAALEAFIFETEGLTPADMDRINSEHGLEAGDAPMESYRLDRLADMRALRACDSDSAADHSPSALHVHRAVRDDGGGIGRATRAKVHGHAMVDAGLNDGDWVDIDADAEPVDGDIVLAEIDGSARVLRRLRIIGGARVLVAANREVEAITILEADRLTIHGVARLAARGI